MQKSPRPLFTCNDLFVLITQLVCHKYAHVLEVGGLLSVAFTAFTDLTVFIKLMQIVNFNRPEVQ